VNQDEHQQTIKERNTCLTMPSIAKEEEVKTVENDVEGEPSWRQKLSLEPTFAHGLLCALSNR
jgi:hypothetical protein